MSFAIRTERLILRPWRQTDVAPFAALSADPEVMRYFERHMTPEDAAAAVVRFQESYAQDGFCFWAVEVPDAAPCIGFVGVARTRFTAPFTPAVEIGWRLARAWWGRGLATEAAHAAMADGFTRCGLDEIVSFAVEANLPSRRVMEHIGMWHDKAGDFDHPNVSAGHPFRRHVLYRRRNEAVLF